MLSCKGCSIYHGMKFKQGDLSQGNPIYMTSEFELVAFQVTGSLKVTKFHGKPVSILECIKH